MRAVVLILLAAVSSFAQSTCPATPAWSPCDLAFDLEPSENPASFDLRAEFRSPHHRTYLMHAFRDGDRHFIIRFSPTEEGAWEYRTTSILSRFDGQMGQFIASSSDSPGFVRVANVHHFATENNQPHLWMATALDRFTAIPRAEFDQLVEQRIKEKFTHLRVTIDAGADIREAGDRILAINQRGLVADVVLAAIPGESSGQRTLYGRRDQPAGGSGTSPGWDCPVLRARQAGG